jgi:N-acetylneuraminic acid mutarotase
MVTGGFDNVGDPSNKVFALDYPTGWFEWWRAMPSGRASHAAAVIPCGEFDVGSDCIYLVGGVVEAARSLSVVDMFDFKTQSWAEVPEIPTARDQLAGTMQDYKVYAIGGRANASGGSLGTTEEYDPETEGWTAKAPMQEARKEMAAAGLDQRRYGDHRIFVFGGESGKGALSIVEAYVPTSDSWVSLSPMPTARHGAGAAVVERTIYVIGGTTADGSVTGANEAFTP